MQRTFQEVCAQLPSDGVWPTGSSCHQLRGERNFTRFTRTLSPETALEEEGVVVGTLIFYFLN